MSAPLVGARSVNGKERERHCPLCETPGLTFYHQDERRCYYHCPHCDLVSVAREQLPSSEEERAHYRWHDNRVDDPRYRAFLARALQPIVERVPLPARGLDFGCGPGPALVNMLAAAGYQMDLYDPLFFPDQEPLQHDYRFITCTEVIEHCHAPRAVWSRLFERLLRPGWLVIMTKRVQSLEAFKTWHYKNDPTHVAFYSEQALRFVASVHDCPVEFLGPDVALFHKPP